MLVTLRFDEPLLPGDSVAFELEGTERLATWRGPALATAGAPVDVELDLPGVIDWRDIILISDGRDQGVPVNGQGFELSGIVEDVDELGVTTIRVGGGLLLLDTAGEPSPSVVGATVSFPAALIELFPTGI